VAQLNRISDLPRRQAGFGSEGYRFEKINNMFYVYVMHSLKFDRTYTGMTNNINRRIKEHNNKQNKSTKAYTPWELIYQE